MQYRDGIGEIVASGLIKIFKNRPNCAYAIFAFLIIVVLGVMILAAQNTEDLIFPIIGLSFILIVVLGRTFRGIWKHRIEENQVTNQVPLDQEEPDEHEIMMSNPEEKINLSPQLEQQVAQKPSSKKGYFRQVLVICVISFALGYLMAYLLGTSIFAKLLTHIIHNWTESQAITDLNSIRIPLVQFLFGLPCAFTVFLPILIVLYIIVARFTKSAIKIFRITHAVISFICGILLFGPIQVLLLFASNI